MREIRLSGSGEGTVLSRPYLISATAVGATAEYLRLIVDGPSRVNRAFRARTVLGGDAEHYTRDSPRRMLPEPLRRWRSPHARGGHRQLSDLELSTSNVAPSLLVGLAQ